MTTTVFRDMNLDATFRIDEATLVKEVVQAPWGANLSILCHSDRKYLPGAYALFNSAILNGFIGEFRLMVARDTVVDQEVRHNQLTIQRYDPRPGRYHIWVQRLQAFEGLSDGNYLHLDADFIVERPCRWLLQPIDHGLLVSTETARYYPSHDVRSYWQCRLMGIDFDLAHFGYVNGGLLGFRLPRDRSFLDELISTSFRLFEGWTDPRARPHPIFPVLDQDVLNVLVRKYVQLRLPITSISTDNIEFGHDGSGDPRRRFPAQTDLPREIAQWETKYLIHGASLRRPWLPAGGSRKLRTRMKMLGVSAVLRPPSPYERAWATYACKPELPIALDTWADAHGFTGHKHQLWRYVFGL